MIEAEGRTLGELLLDIDRRFPGLRFRIIDEQDNVREHIKIFINEEAVRDLRTSLSARDVIHIVAALSGGRVGFCRGGL